MTTTAPSPWSWAPPLSSASSRRESAAGQAQAAHLAAARAALRVGAAAMRHAQNLEGTAHGEWAVPQATGRPAGFAGRGRRRSPPSAAAASHLYRSPPCCRACPLAARCTEGDGMCEGKLGQTTMGLIYVRRAGVGRAEGGQAVKEGAGRAGVCVE